METATITVLDGRPVLFDIDGEIALLRKDLHVPLDAFLAGLETEGWTVKGEMPPVTEIGRHTIPLVKS